MRLVFAFTLVFVLTGCGWWSNSGRYFVQDISDIATKLCDIYARENPGKIGGMSPKKFCRYEKNLRPFVDQALNARFKSRKNVCQEQ